MKSGSTLAALVAFVVAVAPSSRLAAQASELPEGPGIAAEFTGDVGIERHPAVVFVENFEQSSFDETRGRWESVSQPELMSLSDDTPPASGGKRSLRVSHAGGRTTGGHLYRRLEPGYEKLHVRFYVKFAVDCGPIHHFFHIGGYNPATPWPQGGAGQRPRGDERFTVGIEPYGDAWTWDYYAYWMAMRGSPPRGQTWGNSFLAAPKPKVVRDKWVCLETMIKMNDVDESNGELALWIDGKRISHLGPGFPKGKWIFDKFVPGEGGASVRWSGATGDRRHFTVPREGEPFEGFRWRSDARLKLNFVWLLVYITKSPQGHVSNMWFDDIVVATEYIGPLAARTQTKSLQLPDLPVEMAVKQRSTTVVPGSDGSLRLTIDDITRGQVIASLIDAEGGSVLAATSLSRGNSAPFKFGKETYQLTLKELNNALVGEDFATFVVSSGSKTAALSERAKIERLLSFIESAEGDVFIRNGVEYSAKDAADHLRTKWSAAGSQIATAEDFIDKIASKSSTSGEPYQVRMASGTTVSASDYLREKLAEIEGQR
jgi:hypothetical protein